MIKIISSNDSIKSLCKNGEINIIAVDHNYGSCNKIYEYISNLNLSPKINYQIVKKEDLSNTKFIKRIHLLFILLIDEIDTINFTEIIEVIDKNLKANLKINIKVNSIVNVLKFESIISDKLIIQRHQVRPNALEKEFMSQVVCGKTIKLSDISNIDSINDKDNKIKNCNICHEPAFFTVINKTCSHQICAKCCSGVLNTNKKCPFCRSEMNILDVMIMKKYIPSYYDIIATILDDINTNASHTVVYVDCSHISKLAERLSYLNVVMSPDKNMINVLNFSESFNLIISHTNQTIDKIKNIKNIICLSSNHDIIKDNKSYGNDFLNLKSKVNLHLIELDK